MSSVIKLFDPAGFARNPCFPKVISSSSDELDDLASEMTDSARVTPLPTPPAPKLPPSPVPILLDDMEPLDLRDDVVKSLPKRKLEVEGPKFKKVKLQENVPSFPSSPDELLALHSKKV